MVASEGRIKAESCRHLARVRYDGVTSEFLLCFDRIFRKVACSTGAKARTPILIFFFV